MQLAVLDADGYAVCLDCGTRVKCGSAGLANLEKRHRASDACKNAQEKRKKEQNKKNTSLFNYFKGPKAPAVPSFWIVSSNLCQVGNKATKMALRSVRGIWANERREARA